MRHEAWDAVVDAYQVVVPSIVVRTEAIFFIDRKGSRIEIDLSEEAARNRISVAEMLAADIDAVRLRFTPDFRQRLDAGELEAIAYMLANTDSGMRFVSADGPAIEAAVMLDDDQRVMALAEVLDLCGMSKPLPRKYSREFTRLHLEEGARRRIQGRGLAGQ